MAKTDEAIESFMFTPPLPLCDRFARKYPTPDSDGSDGWVEGTPPESQPPPHDDDPAAAAATAALKLAEVALSALDGEAGCDRL